MNILPFLDSDDWWSDTKLETGVSYLSKEYDFIYTDYIVVNLCTNKTRLIRTRQVHSCIFSDLLRYGNPIACSSVIVKRSLMASISGFSECPSLVSNEDFDAWLRISKLTNKFKRISSPDTFYLQSNENLSSSPRSLISLNKFSNLYFPVSRNILLLPFWLNYLQASGNFKAKNYYASFKYSFCVLLSSLVPNAKHNRITITLKAVCILLASPVLFVVHSVRRHNIILALPNILKHHTSDRS